MRRPNDKRRTKYKHNVATGAVVHDDGKPERDSVINHDDILNIRILIATCGDVGEFVKKL